MVKCPGKEPNFRLVKMVIFPDESDIIDIAWDFIDIGISLTLGIIQTLTYKNRGNNLTISSIVI